MSGRGINGYLNYYDNKIYFRSSLEMLVYIYLCENNVRFELSKHRIEYDNGNKTYNPDIVIDNTIIEIKPKFLLNCKTVVDKLEALKNYCNIFNLKFKIITEDSYEIWKYFNKDFIELLIKENKLILSDKQKERLYNYNWKFNYGHN